MATMAEQREILYDVDGNETDDEALAVRGVLVSEDGVELDSWVVDPKSLAGDEGELATRPGDADLD
jgi:hypothetical protein